LATPQSTTQSLAHPVPKPTLPGVDCSTLRGVMARPSSICGKQGWEYLWTVYYKPMCSSCHATETQHIGKTLFADSDLNTAYSSAIAILSTPLTTTSVQNQFIEVCNMRVGEPIYNDLLFWLDHRVSCP
ncbi:MAG: hypothetical protein AABZ55_01580, partial [Bdellovibrionota bacterium]